MDSKRRKLLSLLGISPAALLAARAAGAKSAAGAAGGGADNGARASGGQTVEGLNPRGIPPAVQLFAMAPRLKTVEGKTLFLVSDGFPGADTFLHEMQIWFSKHMPSVKTVYRLKAGSFTQEDPALNAEIKAQANGVIMAIGH
jgi:hypothetical protein